MTAKELADRAAGSIGGETSRRIVRQLPMSIAAVLVTYYAAKLLGLSDVTWALISALYVMQDTVDDTGRMAGMRAASTVLGSVVGIGSVALMPDLESTPLRLGVVTLVLAVPVGWQPGLRFAYMPALLLAVPSGENPMSAAFGQGAAILLGAALGVLTSLLVWPRSSKRRARRALALAIEDCRELAQSELGLLVEDGEKHRLDELRRSFWRHMNTAQQASEHSYLRRRLKSGERLTSVVRGVERLWYSLVLLDWVCAARGTRAFERSVPSIAPPVRQVRDIVSPVLDDIAQGMRNSRAPLEASQLKARLARARRVVRQCAGVEGRPEPEIGPYSPVLAFALDELTAALDDVSELVGRPAAESPVAAHYPGTT